MCADYIEFVKRVMVPDYTEDDKGAMVFGPGPPPPEQEDRIKPGPPGMYRQKFFVPRKSNVCFPTSSLPLPAQALFTHPLFPVPSVRDCPLCDTRWPVRTHTPFHLQIHPTIAIDDLTIIEGMRQQLKVLKRVFWTGLGIETCACQKMYGNP